LHENHELLHHQLLHRFEEDLLMLRQTFADTEEQLKAWKRKPRRDRDSKPGWWP
jgi:hypothetical protein